MDTKVRSEKDSSWHEDEGISSDPSNWESDYYTGTSLAVVIPGLATRFACYQNYKLTWCKGWTAGNIGDILLNSDDDHLSDAELWFQKAIEADSRNGMRWQLATDHACYADWFKKKGDIQGAKEQLTKAIDLFKECGAEAG